MNCKAIIFDMGDVLYDASGWRRWLHERFNEMGVGWSFPELVEAWEGYLVPVYQGRKSYTQAYDEFLASVLSGEAEREAFRAESLEAKARFESNHRKPFEGIRETLAALRASGIKLAVLTDTESPAEKIEESIAQLGLDGLFDAVISSADTGYVKPQAEAYQAALAALGCTAEQAVFVGHDQDELDGAAAAGLKTLALETTGPVQGHQLLRAITDVPTEVVELSDADDQLARRNPG